MIRPASAEPRRLRRAPHWLAVLVLLLGPLVVAGLVPSTQALSYFILTEFSLALVVASLVTLRTLRTYVGIATAVAGVCLAWGVLSLLASATASSCPGTGSTHSCTASQLAANVLLAALLPIVPVVIFAPLHLFARALRRVIALARRVSHAAMGESTPPRSRQAHGAMKKAPPRR